MWKTCEDRGRLIYRSRKGLPRLSTQHLTGAAVMHANIGRRIRNYPSQVKRTSSVNILMGL